MNDPMAVAAPTSLVITSGPIIMHNDRARVRAPVARPHGFFQLKQGMEACSFSCEKTDADRVSLHCLSFCFLQTRKQDYERIGQTNAKKFTNLRCHLVAVMRTSHVDCVEHPHQCTLRPSVVSRNLWLYLQVLGLWSNSISALISLSALLFKMNVFCNSVEKLEACLFTCSAEWKAPSAIFVARKQRIEKNTNVKKMFFSQRESRDRVKSTILPQPFFSKRHLRSFPKFVHRNSSKKTRAGRIVRNSESLYDVTEMQVDWYSKLPILAKPQVRVSQNSQSA